MCHQARCNTRLIVLNWINLQPHWLLARVFWHTRLGLQWNIKRLQMERLANKKLKESNLFQKVTPLSCAYCYSNERFPERWRYPCPLTVYPVRPQWYSRGTTRKLHLTHRSHNLHTLLLFPSRSPNAADYVICFTLEGPWIFAEMDAEQWIPVAETNGH